MVNVVHEAQSGARQVTDHEAGKREQPCKVEVGGDGCGRLRVGIRRGGDVDLTNLIIIREGIAGD